MIDLDDTTNCPEDNSCIGCRRTDELMVRTIGSPVGVFCVTMCADCTDGDDLPYFSVVSAVHASLDHCGHLGITADEMAEAMT